MGISAAEAIRRLQKVRNKIPEKVEDLILISKELKDAKTDELERGLRPDGNKIGKYRNKEYATYKNALNPRAGFGNADLINTTYFSRTLFPYSRGNSKYLFGFQASYGNKLVIQYGADILGINQNTFNDIQRNFIAPELIRFIKQQIGQ